MPKILSYHLLDITGNCIVGNLEFMIISNISKILKTLTTDAQTHTYLSMFNIVMSLGIY